MGHREDLLEGAKRCLLEKGFARTTARDIVRESGTNLASIGYHYGSKDELLATAYVDLVGNQSDAFDPASEVAGTEPGSYERFRLVWSNIAATMGKPDSLWRLSVELIALGEDRLPKLRALLVDAQREGARGLVSMLTDIPEDEIDDELTDTLGALCTVLMTGLIAQYSLDPEQAPKGGQLADGMWKLAEGMMRAART
jgi:AcrR family transcriptional regulator